MAFRRYRSSCATHGPYTRPWGKKMACPVEDPAAGHRPRLANILAHGPWPTPPAQWRLQSSPVAELKLERKVKPRGASKSRACGRCAFDAPSMHLRSRWDCGRCAFDAPSMRLRCTFDAPSKSLGLWPMPLRCAFDAPSMRLRCPFDAPSMTLRCAFGGVVAVSHFMLPSEGWEVLSNITSCQRAARHATCSRRAARTNGAGLKQRCNVQHACSHGKAPPDPQHTWARRSHACSAALGTLTPLWRRLFYGRWGTGSVVVGPNPNWKCSRGAGPKLEV